LDVGSRVLTAAPRRLTRTAGTRRAQIAHLAGPSLRAHKKQPCHHCHARRRVACVLPSLIKSISRLQVLGRAQQRCIVGHPPRDDHEVFCAASFVLARLGWTILGALGSRGCLMEQIHVPQPTPEWASVELGIGEKKAKLSHPVGKCRSITRPSLPTPISPVSLLCAIPRSLSCVKIVILCGVIVRG
jgi:hypothetical protein